MSMEIELKLALDARHTARLRRHPLLAGARPRRRMLHSVYHDTPDFALLRRAIALRLRRMGMHWVQTLKAEAPPVGALSRRPEWEIPVAGGAPDLAALPPEALELLQGIDLTRLAPVFVTEFRRTTWALGDEDGVELALDEGEIRAGGACQPISEIELELRAGSADALFDLSMALLESLPLRLEPRSKAERGYFLCEAAAPAPVNARRPDLRAGHAATEAWAELVRCGLAQAVANVPGFLERGEDIEYLHQLRVALRRLRAAVGLIRALGGATPAWAAALQTSLRDLNPARDWDVFLHETLPEVQAVLADAPLGEALQEGIRRQAADARRAAQAGVASAAFTRLVLEIGRDLTTPRADGPTARAWSRGVLDKRWKRLRALCPDGPAALTPEARHRLRIAAKKLRYAADALEGLYGKHARPFLKRLADLQESLGRANDARIATHLLEDLRRRNLDLAYDAGRVAGIVTARASQRDADVDAVWRRMLDAPPFWR